MYDVCIIGGGIIGSAIARELSKYELKICLLEKNSDVAAGTTKANSGIVHGGYDAKHGSVKAQFSAAGNRMYKKLDEELHFGFAQTGSFVIGFNEKDAAKIQQIYENGQKNGDKEIKVVDSNFIKAKEPHLNKDVTVALYCSSAGITSPYEFAIALAENAVQNGVDYRLNTEVIAITKDTAFTIETNIPSTVTAKCVINAAGLYADDVAKMVGLNEFTISPRKGQYLLLDKDQGSLTNSVIFQTPTEISKGILVAKTYHGNLLIGPDAETISDKDYLDTASDTISEIVAAARKSVPDFDMRKVITSFAGNRAASSVGDFIIEQSKVPGFINTAGIESPGLTAAPAIAEYVSQLVEETGIKLTKKADFDPHRKPYHTVANMTEEELQELIHCQPDYGRIICRCETVSEGEIRDACNRDLPINSLDAIKRRTRAGMGRCQGGFCTPRVMEIMTDALNINVDKITKKGKGSELVMGRTKRALGNKQ